MFLAQGHTAVMLVRLEPADPQSRVKHSTTEPLRSLWSIVHYKGPHFRIFTIKMKFSAKNQGKGPNRSNECQDWFPDITSFQTLVAEICAH